MDESVGKCEKRGAQRKVWAWKMLEDTTSHSADIQKVPRRIRRLRKIDPRLISKHNIFVLIYAVAFLIMGNGLIVITDIIFFAYQSISTGSFQFDIRFADFGRPWQAFLIIVLLQGLILVGIGTVRITRPRGRRFLTAASFISLSVVATILTICAFFFFLSAADAAHITFKAPSVLGSVSIGLSIWVIWVVLGLVYWKREKSTFTHRAVHMLVASSWIEFSLALPIYIATRDNDKCYWLGTSYFNMLLVTTACLILFGPGLYLFYLKQLEIHDVDPSRARKILLSKSSFTPDTSDKQKSDNYVSNARTMSLIAIALGFLGLELGIFNEQRGALFSECRDIVLTNYLKGQFKDDKSLTKLIQESTTGADHPSAAAVVRETPFGRVEITERPSPLLGESTGFTAKVNGVYESWTVKSFSLDSDPLLHKLEGTLDELDIKDDLTTNNVITELRRKLYEKEVKIPGLDFWSFRTGAAGWIILLLSTLLLVALRGALRQIPYGSDGGIAEPWLVFDSKSVAEHIVAAIWRNSTAWSGWLATFGVMVAAESNVLVKESGADIATIAVTYLVFAFLFAVNTRTAMQILDEIRRVRLIRAEWFLAERSAAIDLGSAASERECSSYDRSG